ncbi:MAG: carbonic anhydrase [Cyclobacteriaceae bacterium]|nr:carbonic anhydrase [Cyclobacteriaceae bacterium]
MCAVSSIDQFLSNNKNWVREVLKTEQHYFENLAKGQQPIALLLGCSDSRVSPSKVLGAGLGELFIHRNIANVVAHSDLNFLSVFQYAIHVLKIRNVIIYGHYGCGGIQAALGKQSNGLIDNWLANVQDVIKCNANELSQIKTEEEKVNRLVELNVMAQMENLRQTSVFRQALEEGIEINLHGWVFDMSTGQVLNLKKENIDVFNLPAE